MSYPKDWPRCPKCGDFAMDGHITCGRIGCDEGGTRRARSAPRPDLSTVAKRNAFYGSDEYRNMTTAEKCAVQGDGFINDYD